MIKRNWYKMYIDAYDDIKFKKLKKHNPERFPSIWTIWCVMLNEAFKNNGYFRQSEELPHDSDTLEIVLWQVSDIYSIAEINEMILELESVDLVTIKDDFVYVKNWEVYQNVSGAGSERKAVSRENKEVEDLITDIVLEFNKITSSRYSPKTDQTRKMIRARLADGYTKVDMVAVINWKFRKWGQDPKMKDFVRPSTLFRPGNFENYLNEIPDGMRNVSGDMIKVRDMYGVIKHVTQEQFDQAAEGFFRVIN